MDVLARLLDGPRARNAFLLRAELAAPWSMRIQDEAPLTIVAVLKGAAHVLPADGTPRHITAGDVIVLRGPDPYTIADDPATAPQVIVNPGQICTTPDGHPLEEMRDLGVRTWGNSTTGQTTLLVGTYLLDSEVSRRLLTALPALVIVPAQTQPSPLITLLATEVVKDEPGQEAVLDRLLDVVLIATLRTWLAQHDSGAPAWYTAATDPVVGPALKLLHHTPAKPWTVASLARATGVSRAALARRFAELVGEPPMSFLTGWRLTLAADLLREPGATLSAVATQVGYGSAYSLSAAFKRERGVSPSAFRAAAVS
jgi:AraC-like DNA-binding protein